jgi:hypothetical protein
MGVRTLIGTYDGTTPAAVMVDSVTGSSLGVIFEGEDAPEQIEAFLDWMRRRRFIADEIGLTHKQIPDPTHGDDTDPRAWPDAGLRKLIAHWRREYWEKARAEAEASGV